MMPDAFSEYCVTLNFVDSFNMLYRLYTVSCIQVLSGPAPAPRSSAPTSSARLSTRSTLPPARSASSASVQSWLWGECHVSRVSRVSSYLVLQQRLEEPGVAGHVLQPGGELGHAVVVSADTHSTRARHAPDSGSVSKPQSGNTAQ